MSAGAPRGHGVIERRLPPQPSSVGEARDLVRDLLAGADRADLIETAVLLVSEVVTNALLHAGTPIDVSATLDEQGLRVEIGDGSLHLPVRRHYAPTSGTGRGMLMLEELVDDWGVTRHRRGKSVWFRLRTSADGAGNRSSADSVTSRPRTETVTISLRNVPLLLHAAWQEHAESLLRELLLDSLDERGPENPIQMHAEATDAIAILEEHIPAPQVNLAPDHLMAEAIEPRVSLAELELPVPVASVPHFATLDVAIETALALARRGKTLTPATQPEIAEFRQWLCREVIEQAAGAEPIPWSVEGEAPFQRYDTDLSVPEVSRAASGRIAADESNQILAVSPAALTLLGYDDHRQLVGRRLVAIVPERYRQAHVAGFTLFLLTGRRPLLDHAVRVPALCRDGSEVMVELLVRAELAGNGRTVFLADLNPAD